MAITLYGASDDCIEIEGDVNEEWSAYGSKDGDLIAFSDGTLLRIRYTDEGDGIWRITPVHVPTPEILTITPAPLNDPRRYTDRAELRTNDIDWVIRGSEMATPRR